MWFAPFTRALCAVPYIPAFDRVVIRSTWDVCSRAAQHFVRQGGDMVRRFLAVLMGAALAATLLGVSATAVLAVNCGVAGSTCYVSPSGNDAFDGNTPATAKQHFGGATGAILAAGAGGKVIAAAGTYNTEPT